MGTEAELLVDVANPSGLITSYLHPDVKRVGAATDFSFKDHLASNRAVQRYNGATTNTDYGPFGKPLTSNGSLPINGKAYLNERYDAETGLIYLHARYDDPNLATSSRRTRLTRGRRVSTSTAMPMCLVPAFDGWGLG